MQSFAKKMDIFSTTTVPMPAPDLPIDMFSPMSASQWLTPLPLTSSFGGCQQPPSPLQLSSPCTPSGSNSRSSGYASTPGSFPVDPYYNQPMQDNYQQMFDDYQNVSFQPTSPFLNYGLSPETNIARFLSELSNCLKQAADKEFSVCQEMWERFVCEFFDDSVLFSVETIGGSEKQRYVLSRDLIAGYFHTYAEAGMSSIQCALGEGHMTRHEDLLRMDYANATCLMDCVKPNLFKAVREGRLLVDMKTEDNLKMTFWYFKINKYNEFILRDTLHSTKDEQNVAVTTLYGLPPGANAYLKKHGQSKVEYLDELLSSPAASTNTTPTFVTPDTNWLLGGDPFTQYSSGCTSYGNMEPKMLPFPPFPSDLTPTPTSSNHHFMPPKNPIKSRPSSWSAPSNKHDSKLKIHHKSTGPKGKKRRRRAPIIMYIAGDPLTLHRDGRLLKNITDTQERKITCINNTFQTLRSDQESKGIAPPLATTKSSRMSKPILKLNTNLSKAVTSFHNTILSSSSSSWTDTLKLLNSNDIKLDQRQICA